MKMLLGLGAVLVLLSMATCGTYNSMVLARNTADNAWGDVEAAYQRRLDTIPNFVKTAKFSADFQLRLATEYARLRENISQAAGSRSPDALQQAANNGYGALLIAVRQEAVPEAKTDQLTELNAQVENMERVIGHQRSAYNNACRNYRNTVQQFPNAVLAGTFGFSASYCDYFKAEPGAERSPGVDFGS